jgi:hypothetical protein
MRNLLLAIAIGCACLALVTTADARSSYDGAWSLIFYTQRGACDQSYNFLVNITNGVVTSPAFPSSGDTGGFRRGSRVVTVRDSTPPGSGRLSGNRVAEAGAATGRERCTGSWVAQRNG